MNKVIYIFRDGPGRRQWCINESKELKASHRVQYCATASGGQCFPKKNAVAIFALTHPRTLSPGVRDLLRRLLRQSATGYLYTSIFFSFDVRGIIYISPPATDFT